MTDNTAKIEHDRAAKAARDAAKLALRIANQLPEIGGKCVMHGYVDPNCKACIDYLKNRLK